MRELRGKVAVVTGAASGIGRAMAERFAREGMKLVLADIQPGPLKEAREAIERGGAEAIAVPTDVSRGEQVDALAARAFEAYGAAHVLCNNAGVGSGGLAWEVPVGDWEWVFGVNQWSVVHGIRAFVPRMIAQGEGHVVNTASMAGLVSAPGMAAYCATKHAVVAMSECLHHDLAITGNGPKVHVSVLCPAWVKTNIAESDRNRPASSPRRPGERRPQELMMEQLVRTAVAGGIPPEDVADQVLQAIVEERFWILTHPVTKRAVEKRARGIVEGKAPSVLDRGDVRFPVPSVERLDAEARARAVVEAQSVDVPVVGVRPRPVERVHPAGAAEHVLRDARVEPVHGEGVLPAQDGEALGRHDDVQVPHPRAHRAVARVGEVVLDVDAESHGPAVAAALVARRHASSSSSVFVLSRAAAEKMPRAMSELSLRVRLV